MLLCTFYSYDFLGHSFKTPSFTHLLILLSFSCPSSFFCPLSTTPSVMFLQRKCLSLLPFMNPCSIVLITLNNKKIFAFSFYITIIVNSKKSPVKCQSSSVEQIFTSPVLRYYMCCSKPSLLTALFSFSFAMKVSKRTSMFLDQTSNIGKFII